ncbi:hypothetical protein KQI85_09400 [Falcatimonas sp. MSJ-15]|uniref:hypothetical protein n=1 Tax=Falcatimonas sp. MSJ-15 TaxID=2841515 RepID=UPI001C11DF3B|nr:hypothetical protein [Falcatimonas sp. MSJ-15]MBU5470589.1 hypothetical protein [Falcatimonas sp. MSJ-15]
MKKFKFLKELGIGVVIAGIILLAIFLMRPSIGGGNEEQTTPMFEENQTRDEKEAGISAGIKIPGFRTISIDAGTRNVSVNFENPKDNPCYFQIDMYISDSSDLIYQSGYIEPGSHIYDIELNHELEAGEYEAIIEYHTFTTDGNFVPLNGATTKCTLIVG